MLYSRVSDSIESVPGGNSLCAQNAVTHATRYVQPKSKNTENAVKSSSESNSSPIDKESNLREPSLLNTGPLGLGYDAD
jgi:hypothetical protein